MVTKNEPTGFQRYCKKNPGATLAEFEEARKKELQKQNYSVGPPNVIFMPNGAIVPRSGISSSEIGQLNGEAAKDSLKN